MVNLKSMKINQITLDESLFRYALEQDKTYGEVALKLLEQIESREIEQAYISAVSYARIIGNYDNEEVARKVQVLLSHFPNLIILPFDTRAAELTSNMQRKYGLSFDQAVVVAAALLTNSQLLISETKSIPVKIPSLLWLSVEDVKFTNEPNE